MLHQWINPALSNGRIGASRFWTRISLLGAGLTLAFVLGRASSGQTAPAPKVEVISIPSILANHPIAKDDPFQIVQLAQGHDASVAVVRAVKDLKPHYHEGRDEIAYIIRGGGTMQLGAEMRPVKAGDLVYIPRGQIHGFINGAKSETVVLSVMSPPFDGKDRHFIDRVETKPVAGD